MNPIENLWAELTQQVKLLEDQPTNVDELHRVLTAAWDATLDQTLSSLVESIPFRIQALISAHGDCTH
mgnify:FL=1